jgi:pimeloyl-ACP methyl ester carboxylesterase
MESFKSKDGSIISYQTLGKGKKIIIVPATMGASQHYMALASQLANKFEIFIINRRGRNGSSPQGENYSLDKECEDLEVLIKKTETSFLFGHSYGAIVTLNTACKQTLSKIALYEPPISDYKPNSGGPEWLGSFREHLSRKDFIGAQVVMMKGLKLLDSQLIHLPEEQIKKIFGSHFNEERLKELTEMLPTVINELKEVDKLGSNCERYAKVTAKTLLMIGKNSPDYLHNSIHSLESILTDYRTKEFSELGHGGPSIIPEIVAQELIDFFE